MIISDVLLKAISWTLIHSVWQGILLAFFTGLVIVFTKKSSSALRYNLLVGLFLMFLVVVGITFNYEFQNEQVENSTKLNLPLQTLSFHDSNNIVSKDFVQLIIDYLNNHSDTIVLIWFVVFSVRCFGIFGSLSNVYRIRNYKTQKPPIFWQHKITELSRRIQLDKTIVLLESRLVKIPSVSGFFKPIILIPVGLLSNLDQDQIEAILLHELAHIRRKDYVVNLLQSFAEILFFFNPGLLWLSSILRDERENCCDDIAIAATESKTKFVNALVLFEEYNLKQNQLAMGFGSSKNHLLNRAKRIICNNNKTLNSIEKTLISASLVVIVAVMIACSNGKQQQVSLFETDKAVAKMDILAQKADARVAAISKSTKAADFLAQKADAEAAKADMEVAKSDQIFKESNERKRQADLAAKQADLLFQQASERVKQATAAAKEADNILKKMEAARKVPQSKTIISRTATSTTTTTVVDDEQPEKNHHTVVQVKTGVSGKNLPTNIEVDQLTNDIISDLISEKIIQSDKNLSYKLSNQSLIVNDVVQPESIKNKLSKKYVKAKGISICYNYVVSDKVNNTK